MKPELKPKAGAAIVPVTAFEQNCTLLWDETTRQAVVVDPGGDVPRTSSAAIKQANVNVERIWLTHGHIDHAGGAAELKERLGGVPIEGPHQADQPMLDNLVASGARFGMDGVRAVRPDRYLDDGDQVKLGSLTFDILHCPGHSPGSVVFVEKILHFALMGDVLFNGSIGRTDLPGGDYATLMCSISEKVISLGDDISFICGHGPGSTIGHERVSNPFLHAPRPHRPLGIRKYLLFSGGMTVSVIRPADPDCASVVQDIAQVHSGCVARKSSRITICN